MNHKISSDTQTKILTAAIREFGERGLSGARMQQIANEAGVNKALLHYYYRNKEQLYRETIKSLITELSDFGAKVMDKAEDLDQLLGAIIDTYFDFMANNPGLFKLMFQEIFNGAETLKAILDMMTESQKDHLFPIQILKNLKKFTKANKLRRDISETGILLTLAGSCGASFIQRIAMEGIIGQGLPSAQEFFMERRHTIKKIMLQGIYASNAKTKKEGKK